MTRRHEFESVPRLELRSKVNESIFGAEACPARALAPWRETLSTEPPRPETGRMAQHAVFPETSLRRVANNRNSDPFAVVLHSLGRIIFWRLGIVLLSERITILLAHSLRQRCVFWLSLNFLHSEEAQLRED